MTRKVTALAFLITGVSLAGVSLAVPATEASRTRQIATGTTIGVANGHVQLSFDRQTGALTSLKNVASGDEYLKTLGGDGNLFRAYVDTKDVPRFLARGGPYPTPPVEDAMGGTLVDPKNCRLEGSSFVRSADSGMLRLVIDKADLGLAFEVEVGVPDRDSAVNLRISVRNNGDAERKLMLAAPYLTGLALGPDGSRNLGVSLACGFGQAGAPAWANCGEVYGRLWGGQWNAVYDPASAQVLGLIVQDSRPVGKMFRRFPGGGMSVFYFNNHRLKPGASIAYPSTQILIGPGNWRLVARRYHEWFDSAFQPRRHPDWFNDIDMFIGPWIPPPQAVAQAKQSPDSSAAFTSFAHLPRLHLPDRYDLKEWAMYWQAYAEKPDSHCNGVFDFRSDLGGAEAFREGTTGVERIGRRVGLYVATQSMRLDSPFFARHFPGTKPEDWMLMETPGVRIASKDPDGGLWFYCCLRHRPWQDYFAGLCKTLVQQTGAKYIRLDEAGAAFLACHNPAHRHADPYDATHEMLEFYRKVRRAVDEVDPQVLIFTENPTDLLSLFCDGSLAMWNAGTELAPIRLSSPGFEGFSYGLGQVECALQGYVPADLAPCGNAGWANGYHETLWGPGLVKKPRSLSIDVAHRPAEFRWNELRHTFSDAMKPCDPTDVDPIGIDQDPDEWAARLWRSEKYWLMVCGNLTGIRPSTPVRVKLPELPESVRQGYEFDFETLAMREIPIARNGDGIFVEVLNGFSAVLLPTPECPPLVVMDVPREMRGSAMELKLDLLAPWRNTLAAAAVAATAPGLNASLATGSLPTSVTITAPVGAESGFYFVQVTGDCLRMKRWFRYQRRN